jgi:hypothetical protein
MCAGTWLFVGQATDSLTAVYGACISEFLVSDLVPKTCDRDCYVLQ